MTVPGLLSQEELARIEERSRSYANYTEATKAGITFAGEDRRDMLAHIRAQDAMLRGFIDASYEFIDYVRDEVLGDWALIYAGPLRDELERLLKIADEHLDEVRAVQSSENPNE